MKKIIVLIMMAFSTYTYAEKFQSQKPVTCFGTQELINSLKNNYDEDLKFSFSNEVHDRQTNISMYANKETGSWTIIEHNDQTACILGVGKTINM